MARIRTIKPEFFVHPEIVVLSRDARYLLVALLTQADDEGRLYDRPWLIGANAFGEADDIDCDILLKELEAEGRIQRYQEGRKRLIQVRNFTRHQRINRPSESALPPPPPFTEDALSAHGDVDTGREGNGKEGKGTKSRRATTLPTAFEPSDDALAWAREHHPAVDPAVETSKFINFHESKGSKFKDWTAAWKTWIGRAATDFAPARGANQAPWRNPPAKDFEGGIA